MRCIPIRDKSVTEIELNLTLHGKALKMCLMQSKGPMQQYCQQSDIEDFKLNAVH